MSTPKYPNEITSFLSKLRVFMAIAGRRVLNSAEGDEFIRANLGPTTDYVAEFANENPGGKMFYANLRSYVKTDNLLRPYVRVTGLCFLVKDESEWPTRVARVNVLKRRDDIKKR